MGNGCLAHSMNLFIKNAVKPDKVKLILANCSLISKFISNHLRVRTFYNNEVRKKFGIHHIFMLPVETRFYTFYTFANSVLENKTGVRYVVEECYEEVKQMLTDTKEFENFIKVVTNTEFWTSLKFLTEKILFPAKELISLFEKDDYCISKVYQNFNDMYMYYMTLPETICGKRQTSQTFS